MKKHWAEEGIYKEDPVIAKEQVRLNKFRQKRKQRGKKARSREGHRARGLDMSDTALPTTWGRGFEMVRLGDLDSFLKELGERVYVKLQFSCYPVWVEVGVNEVRGLIRVVNDPDVTVPVRLSAADVYLGW